MASRYKKICYLCGKEYQYCSNCRDFRTQPAWKNMFDTEDCHEIFNISTQFAQGYLSKEEAKEKLKKHDLSNMTSFKPEAIEQIQLILIESPKEEIVEEVAVVKTNDEAMVEEKEELIDKTGTLDIKDTIPEASTFKKKKKSMKKISN